MSIRTSIILLVALAMVAGYVFFVQLRQVEEEEEEPPWFYNLDIQDLTRIQIDDPEGVASFHLGDEATGASATRRAYPLAWSDGEASRCC